MDLQDHLAELAAQQHVHVGEHQQQQQLQGGVFEQVLISNHSACGLTGVFAVRQI